MNQRIVVLMLAVATVLPLGGCAGRDQRTGAARRDAIETQRRDIPAAPQPPVVPPLAPQPLDIELRARARQQIITSAASPDPVVRAHAMEGLKALPAPFPGKLFDDAFNDPQTVVRFAALLAAGEMRRPEARDQALRLMKDENSDVQLAAIFCLHRLGDTRYSRRFEETAMSSDYHTRANTAMLLGMLGEPSADKILKYMMNDTNATVRLQVAEALWRLSHNTEALETLITATISRFPDDQMIAAIALAEGRDPRVVEHLRGLLTTSYPEVNLVAARALGMLGRDDGYSIAVKAIGSVDPRQRELACLALGAIGRVDAQHALADGLHSASPEVKVAAALGILQLK